MTTLTIIGKPDCHLCVVAREVIDSVIADLPVERAAEIEIDERSILDDPMLYDIWWEKVPVVLLDGDLHAYWRISPDSLREALQPRRRRFWGRAGVRAGGRSR